MNFMARNAKRGLLMPASALLLAVLLAAASVFGTVHASAPIPPITDATGTDISDFSAQTIDGERLDGTVFGQYTVTVLHYFATWSGDCIRELGYMQLAFEEFAPEVNVIGILHEDATSTPAAAAALMEKYGIEYDCVLPDSVLSSLVSRFNYIPQTFIISGDGIVLEQFPGVFDGFDSLRAHIEYWTGKLNPKYTLQFLDGLTGLPVKTLTVPEGKSAEPPAPPFHPGFVFREWRGKYTDVHESGRVIAVYRFVGPAPALGDVDVDGHITAADSLITARHAMGISSSPSAARFGDIDGDGSITVNDSLIIIRIALGIA